MSLRLYSYLVRGDSLVLDRWRWITRRLPETRNAEPLLDVGCGSGAFTIGAALRGYHALGLSWDQRNQGVATARAAAAGVSPSPGLDPRQGHAAFQTADVRHLDQLPALQGKFEAALCCECAEHILDDRKLFRDIAACLRPGGRLLFTAPNYCYRAISRGDLGPFQTVEQGGHVRRGYSEAMLRELCETAGLRCEEITYCSGFLSQKVTALLRFLSRLTTHQLAWAATFPLRILPWLDPLLAGLVRHPGFSICMVAVKPRFAPPPRET